MSDDETRQLRHAVTNQLTVISLCAQKCASIADESERKNYLGIIQERCRKLEGLLR